MLNTYYLNNGYRKKIYVITGIRKEIYYVTTKQLNCWLATLRSLSQRTNATTINQKAGAITPYSVYAQRHKEDSFLLQLDDSFFY